MLLTLGHMEKAGIICKPLKDVSVQGCPRRRKSLTMRCLTKFFSTRPKLTASTTTRKVAAASSSSLSFKDSSRFWSWS